MSAYVPTLPVLQRQAAIKSIKDFFQQSLATELNLHYVTAPIYVMRDSGLNDDLTGHEDPISFTARGLPDTPLEIVQSLAKWKRLKLAQMDIPTGEGIWTDMNTVRPNDIIDATHALRVDQFEWCKRIEPSQRNTATFQQTVQSIYKVLRATEEFVSTTYHIPPELPETITFVSTSDLIHDMPKATTRERENAMVSKHKAVFLSQIGWVHDLRAPDYDDWNLNGDILVQNSATRDALELSSMGIRVDSRSMYFQLKCMKQLKKLSLPFHSYLMKGQLPQTIGGGIGIARLCMFLLKSRHIGEVTSGVWPGLDQDAMSEFL